MACKEIIMGSTLPKSYPDTIVAVRGRGNYLQYYGLQSIFKPFKYMRLLTAAEARTYLNGLNIEYVESVEFSLNGVTQNALTTTPVTIVNLNIDETKNFYLGNHIGGTDQWQAFAVMLYND